MMQEETPVNIYKDEEDRFRTWHFPHHDFTLMILWSKFLVTEEERIINGSKSGIFDLQLDKVSKDWTQKLPGIDYAIISSSHWFFRKLYLYKGGALTGCVYCNEPNVTTRGIEFAIRMSFRAALSYINHRKDLKGTTTLVRTISPAHFENGAWDTGGSCKRTSPSPMNESEGNFSGSYLEIRSIQLEEIERARRNEVKKRGKRFEILDVTKAMLMRPDGHPNSHWDNKWMKGYNDCVHWCLPGPIDAWNDFLLAILLKKKTGKQFMQ